MVLLVFATPICHKLVIDNGRSLGFTIFLLKTMRAVQVAEIAMPISVMASGKNDVALLIESL